MKYVDFFTFPDQEVEFDFLIKIKQTVYNSFYPFKTLSKRQFERIDFEPITILYGGNGSGKTTALNVIAEKLSLQREARFNRSSFYEKYLHFCEVECAHKIPPQSRIITSDDVFDYILDIRTLNEGIDERREEVFQEYLSNKYAKFQMRSMEDYDQLHQILEARKNTQSQYVRNELMGNVREYSNGENAYRYFTEKIEDNGLYLLDESENSLSPIRQLELAQFLEDSARFFGCQFIISTHSPFLLAMKGAKIYDLDAEPLDIKPWTELSNVRHYYDFFQKHKDEFQ
ncbi:AAA family ATPase [Jeotgalibaca caeni]|uniref:AAA family ATPase n=1 Tax=Jeotgalibaca caeni TaxID=3028623 RepID=UPI00237E251C|nr:AAA family ATPase [Jeotgalibaca caeni]MDE1547813.1 AAA family ATPase [Jeotgalibaca caeni]